MPHLRFVKILMPINDYIEETLQGHKERRQQNEGEYNSYPACCRSCFTVAKVQAV
jgi:hypothetical protein